MTILPIIFSRFVAYFQKVCCRFSVERLYTMELLSGTFWWRRIKTRSFEGTGFASMCDKTLVGTRSHAFILYYGGELGSVVGPVIQANGRLTFEDDLK